MVRLDHISKKYSNGDSGASKSFTVLQNVSFDIKPGEIFGLIGSSGAGKSTIGKMLLGLVSPDAGKVYFKDQDLSDVLKKNKSWYRNHCQAIFQDPKASMSPKLKIKELLTEPLALMPTVDPSDYDTKIKSWLDKVNLDPSVLDRFPKQLSGGEAQRICIIRALMRDPEFLICDEPTSGLDVSTEWEIISLIKKMQSSYNLGVLFMTHNLYLLPALADRIGIMHHGQLIEMGTVNQVFRNPSQDFTKQLVKSTLLNRNV